MLEIKNNMVPIKYNKLRKFDVTPTSLLQMLPVKSNRLRKFDPTPIHVPQTLYKMFCITISTCKAQIISNFYRTALDINPCHYCEAHL